MSQPQWKRIANLGDVSPLEYGGYFVYVDETGVYPPKAEIVQEPCEGLTTWTIYRFILEPCTYQNGILSDNRFHPEMFAWFAQSAAERLARPQDTTNLANVARTYGTTEEDIITLFCSENPTERAEAWRMVGEYHGLENLDSYPLTLTLKEINARYPEFALDEDDE